MGKQPKREEITRDVYDLKTDAVEELLQAHRGDAPRYSMAELEKYRRKKFSVPNWLKMVLIKAWFCGAVCFFFLWGLGTYIYGLVDMLFILAVALGMVNDLLVNNVIRFFAETPGGNDGWMMFPRKGTASFFLNIVYFGVILMGVYGTYNALNYIIITLTGAADTIPIGVEPILFGLLCMGLDLLLLGAKHLLLRIVEDAKDEARRRL